MRASAALFHSSPVSKTATPETTSAANETFSPPATIGNSSWHSPVPYLFGGLAAMLGLIAFALLILACSYWKLSGQVGAGEEGAESGAAAKCDGGEDTRAAPPFEEKFLVIMAGDVKPTFLATPTSSRNSSFNDDNKIHNVKGNENEKIPGNGEEFREIQSSQEYVQT
ncbi:protein GLUTAMINE DUMPER 2-like [Salvia miltiorrhiza]|uniref:protein GLUTAMINE DUMPER 2-like n=1 Tax=Salvia miltiorrhiza TaxID=226208 RepID=UPI0025ABEFBC|nr:protein GLUTAMINE DUMPER 2-like [Salvia miltiorrhiza]XP_057810355.1 protein GLUTAMINE DUMPER 2-like [Salvia miltiorrhiza]